MTGYPLAIPFHLPTFCYNPTSRTIRGALIHYFSCINVDKKRWSDPRRCWELFRDLNCEPDDRAHDIYDGPKTWGSAGYMVDRDGLVYELVPPGPKSWHAGASILHGLEDCNSFTEGIEVIAAPQVDPVLYGYNDKQYWSTAMLLRWLMLEHGFTPKWISGHDVVRKAWNDAHPDRRRTVKTDPGTYAAPRPWWDWGKFLSYVGV